VRTDFSLSKFPHALAELLLFFGKAEFHGRLGNLLGLANTKAMSC
jgi:hypothetical protein